MKKTEEKKVEKALESLLEMLEIDTEYELNALEEAIDITLTTDEGGILIGYHGETLDALQLIISLVLAKHLGRFVRVTLEIGDYKKARTQYLENLVKQSKERALSENRAIVLPELKPWERRVIHLMLENDDEVSSQSSGEGRQRTLTILPKN